jgi:hypothetical protein
LPLKKTKTKRSILSLIKEARENEHLMNIKEDHEKTEKSLQLLRAKFGKEDNKQMA